MLMIAPPPPCFTIWRAAACPARKVPLRFTAITRSKSASARSRNSAAWTIPALATRMSTRPNSLTAAAIAASTSILRETSQRAKLALKPSERNRRVSPRPASSFTSVSSTRAPSRAKARAHARPMPCAAPVTTATLSESLTNLFRRGLHGLGELGAESIHPLGAACHRARIDGRLVVFRGGALQPRVNPLLELGVFLHQRGDRVDALPFDHEAHQRIGVPVGDGARVAMAIVLPRLVELVPVVGAFDRLLAVRRVGL